MQPGDYKPKGKLNKKHLLTLLDYSAAEIYEILHMAVKLKKLQYQNKKHSYLKGKTIAMLFSKASTRTRISFEQGIKQLGASPMLLSANEIQLNRGESIYDTAKVLSKYNIDGIMIRTFNQSDVEDFAKYGSMSVINGLTDDFHPCQALADMLTIYEVFGKLNGLKLAYFGDGNNVTNSLMLAGAKLGLQVYVCTPQEYRPSQSIFEEAKKFGTVILTDDPQQAALDADVVYTDVFFSMGQENAADKLKKLLPYQVNADLMAKANKDAVFMHCLPAHRDEEVTAEVIDSPRSVVFEQAENRLHAQKAIMTLLMKD